MPSTAEVALVSVPMAVYLYALGVFHGGKHPRVVSGPVDLAWLALGLSGLVAFGPVGRVAVPGIFGSEATWVAWSIWVLGLVLVAAIVARTGRNQLVIYHVVPDQIRTATRAALSEGTGSFTETLQGFEDRASGTIVVIRASPRVGAAVVDAQGGASGQILKAARPKIETALQAVDRPTSTISTALFVASSLIMLAPVLNFVTFDPQGRRTVRVLGGWLKWW